MAKSDEETTSKEKGIRVVWGSDEDLPVIYANQLYISHGGETEFHLLFGHLSPPLTVGLTEDELPDMIKVKPVAKIVLAPKVMRGFVDALNINLEKFDKKTREHGNDSD